MTTADRVGPEYVCVVVTAVGRSLPPWGRGFECTEGMHINTRLMGAFAVHRRGNSKIDRERVEAHRRQTDTLLCVCVSSVPLNYFID